MSILHRILAVTEIGKSYTIAEVTVLVLQRFPDWEFGLTPAASIRRDLNHSSDRHVSVSKARFRTIRGRYQRLR